MNIRLDLIQDPDVIKKAVMIDDLYKDLITEDIETWYPNLELTAFLYVFKDDVPFGMIALEKFSSNALIIHGGVFKDRRGINTPEVFREVIKQVEEKTKKQVITYVTSNNKACLRMMEKAGMKQKCTINNDSIKGDIIILVVE
jgi:hypothetical protein